MARSQAYRQRSRTVIVARTRQMQQERAAAGQPLTVRELAQSLGVSESTIYKTRAGTRSGTKVLPKIRRADQDIYTVVVETRDEKTGETKFKTVNVSVSDQELRKAGIKRRAFSESKIAAHPNTHKQIEKLLERRGERQWREARGSETWSVKERQSMKIKSARRPIDHSVAPRELHLRVPFPKVLGGP